ncbi:MAG TPA: hypothetical protein VLF79_02780 [Candidatus Saccharimonadales bacterium]|nr:hypothetical protein [Candidatus Saccharimonadales bacterium]
MGYFWFFGIRQVSYKVVLVSGIFALFITAGLIIPTVQAQNISIDTARDCDSNAVIWCGAGSVNQLINKYNNGDGRNSAESIHHILGFFGISSAEINSMDSNSMNIEAGRVTKAGNVLDGNGTEIATDALTGGRENIAGSTQVTHNGTTFFTRPPSVSFVSNSLSAYIVRVNGNFSFAILASCGNPVKATPKVVNKPVPQPTPQPVAPTATPPTTPPTPTVNQVSNQINNQTQTTTVNAPATPVTPVATPAPAPAATAAQPTALVNTGPGGVAGLFVISSIVGTIGYRYWLVRHLTGN